MVARTRRLARAESEWLYSAGPFVAMSGTPGGWLGAFLFLRGVSNRVANLTWWRGAPGEQKTLPGPLEPRPGAGVGWPTCYSRTCCMLLGQKVSGPESREDSMS